ncbi:MAG TPA: PIN domain nuclease [Chloroflexota bacterium]|nr:PIN domain nuclease [Chloroflexota bacterium]
MRLYLYFRILGAALVGWLGWTLSAPLAIGWVIPIGDGRIDGLRLIPTVLGVVIGAWLFPHVTIDPFMFSRRTLRRTPASDLLAGLIGLVAAGIVAVVASVPFSQLPGIFGRVLPLAVFLLLGWIFVELAIARKDELLGFVTTRRLTRESRRDRDRDRDRERTREPEKPPILMDTSSIIDGRIADISQTGFIFGELVVPKFVLLELQHIADSSDALRRNRGRRGLDMLNRLQKESPVTVRILDVDVDGAPDVDGKLVNLAKRINGSILTNDFNLNRVAELQGVLVLNINELANAVKSVVLPGEDMSVQVIQEGKEQGQGVGYLDDGTMIVVENGKRYIGSGVDVVVSRVLQTVAGRMIFAHPKEGAD